MASWLRVIFFFFKFTAFPLPRALFIIKQEVDIFCILNKLQALNCQGIEAGGHSDRGEHQQWVWSLSQGVRLLGVPTKPSDQRSRGCQSHPSD